MVIYPVMDDPEKIDFRKTLNLPKTDFPMKANLARKEPEFLRFWEDNKIYQRRVEQNRPNSKFILHDGPPYANGHLHIGHALNKILKDIIVKYKLMKGYYAPYVPGWDCHGLPIELQVDKKLGSKKHDMPLPERRKLCRNYAAGFVDIQREEFKRMGGFGDWDTPYLTMSKAYEAATVREFGKFVRKGYVYQGKKPVHWCPSCATALAEAEVEHADKTSPSVYVKFQVSPGEAAKVCAKAVEGSDKNDKKISIVIWTTTPWTLPANLALAVNPAISYVFVRQGQNDILILAENRYKALKDELALALEPLHALKGRDLVGMQAMHPFIERASQVVAADYVSTEDGSGVVHIAPGHGEEDYKIGLEHGLDVYAPVDNRGRFTDGVAEFAGKFVFKANEDIIETLSGLGALLKRQDIVHSYPHCWRCKKPVIFRATEQWFISMAHEDLRSDALKEIDRVEWHPKAGRNRIYGMVEKRPDWCISRQRVWGVPITLLKCKKCGTHTTDEEALESFINHVSEKGADVWFEKESEALLPAGYTCKKCGADEFDKEMDILDVWFDSGVSHAAVLEENERLSWPADLYLEGSDQHRGWFQSSLLASVGTRKSAPYRAVLTHGFIVDGKGRKMSKSDGNVVSPHEIINRQGAEILRLWVSAADYQEDVKISNEILSRLVEAYRKIRNTCRYLLGNLYDFDPAIVFDPSSLPELDRFALSRLNRLIKQVSKAYDSFRFHEVYHLIYSFCVIEMSSFYLDILKDRLYTMAADSKERRGSQWVLYQVLKTLTGLMAPILSFTAEEVHSFTPAAANQSVFLEPFPKVEEALIDEELESDWMRLIDLRDEVNKALEIKRREKFIGNSLEASVTLYLDEDLRDFLGKYSEDLAMIFIVSEARPADLQNPPSDSGLFQGEVKGSKILVLVERSDGKKCQRCWNWRADVKAGDDGQDICARCKEVLAG